MSSRLAAKKRSAAGLAEARRQKRQLTANKEAAAAAAALPFATPLGTRRDTASPPDQPLPGPSRAAGQGSVDSLPSETATAGEPPSVPAINAAATHPKVAKARKAPKASKPKVSEVATGVQALVAAPPPPTTAAMARDVATLPAHGPAPLDSCTPPAVHIASGLADATLALPPLPAAANSGNENAGPRSPSATPAHASGPIIDVADSDSDTEAPGEALPSLACPRPQHLRPASRTRAPSARSIPAHSPFDLSEFLSRFHAGAAAIPSPPRPPRPQSGVAPANSLTSRADACSDLAAPVPPPDIDPATLYVEFTRFLQSRVAPAAHIQPPAREPFPASLDAYSWTLPNDKGALPPAAVRNLRAADFPPPAHRARGDFVPAAVHILAAHRLYPFLLSPEGLNCTPMELVMRMRLLDCLRFRDAPPILGATHSARFGRHGITIMHFLREDLAAQLAAGSSDANYSLDFGSNVAPPSAPTCNSYNDLLGAVQGLTTFANAEWYEPMAHVLYRLREFVTANMDADPGHTPARVQRTLHEVNRLLGDAFVHLASDLPTWWRDFSAAVHRISYSSSSWAVALCSLAPAAVPATRDSYPRTSSPPQRRATHEPSARGVQTRPGGFPANMRALIPRNAEGQEPCLRFFAGSICFGGAASTCAVRNRLHAWPDELPAALLAFIKKKFGRHDPGQRRRA
ncbi:uncharacterized protein IUM83_02422 [Phytophthora cinnamomi]|uniref:uncharacterized protein n=1 Tax=Phytophthora cinnamomi TaxID=4785 RepID=UPI00355A9BB9|nr:hypothetical protein IUM83_02422 [Phytophthora cinnamomi]